MVGKATRMKMKRSLELGSPIMSISFDEIPDDSDDTQATTPQRPYRET